MKKFSLFTMILAILIFFLSAAGLVFPYVEGTVLGCLCIIVSTFSFIME